MCVLIHDLQKLKCAVCRGVYGVRATWGRDLWIAGSMGVLVEVNLHVVHSVKFMGGPLGRVHEVVSRNLNPAGFFYHDILSCCHEPPFPSPAHPVIVLDGVRKKWASWASSCLAMEARHLLGSHFPPWEKKQIE